MLNTTVCGDVRTNTGFGDCPFDMKNIVSVFLSKTPITISKANLATPALTIAALLTASLDTAKNRLYPVNNIVGLTGDIEKPVTQTLGYGAIVTLKDGYYNLTLQFVKGGLCLSNALRGFNYSYPYALLVDANGVLIGTKVGETLQSFPLVNFFQSAFGINDGKSKVSNYEMNIVFEPKFINENIGFQVLGSTFSVNGLQDVILSETTGSAKPVLKIVAGAGCDHENILIDFATELADKTLWKAYNSITGADIIITSVAISITGIATVTVDATDPDYPTSGQGLAISLTTATLLDAAGVSGFESMPLIIPVA